MNAFIVLNPLDNVGVALRDLPAGEAVSATVRLCEPVARGHKFALADIPAGAAALKYGTMIARATAAIPAGAWVHTHNVTTTLSGPGEYWYDYDATAVRPPAAGENAVVPMIMAFPRSGDRIGIRNEIWVVPTVGCVNRLTQRLAAAANANRPGMVDAVVAFPHPYGCTPPGDDLDNTRAILANLACHPNAGGVLYVGLGCENNIMAEFRDIVESRPGKTNVRYMVAQDVEDEMAEGMRLLDELLEDASRARRIPVPVSRLSVGMKCGASDGLSGITANPLLGSFADWLVWRGGRVMLTEVPKMFGAEAGLLNRAETREVFDRGVAMIENFKRYFLQHGREIHENPSPGNLASGISTLEDKSIGCVQKVGRGVVTDIVPYGGRCSRSGVSLLSGPGEDMVAVTNLAAAGAHLVLFSTGTGNPLGGPVPVIKVSSNAALSGKKRHWIDFDAGPLASGETLDAVTGRFLELVLDVASGRHTRNEEYDYRDFTIFKIGVTL